MVLVHVVPSLKVGGLEILLKLLVARQVKQWNVAVICLDERGTIADDVTALGARVISLGGLELAPHRKLTRLVRALRSLRPDIIHTHNPSPHLYTTVAKCAGIRGAVIHTRHGRQQLSGALGTISRRLAIRHTAMTIAVSRDVAEMVKREGFSSDRVVVVHNAVDVSVYRPAMGPLSRAVAVGRLDPLKDHATLIRAAALVRREQPQFTVKIAGEGRERSMLENLRAELDLNSCVELMGTRSDIAALLEESGLFVLSSVSEGIPLTLLEAMASRLPIVSTNVGGIPEILEDRYTAALVPPSDPRALAAAILDCISAPADSAAMAARAHTTALQHFDIQALVGRYEEIYTDAMARAA